jgi:hypothetical protein
MADEEKKACMESVGYSEIYEKTSKAKGWTSSLLTPYTSAESNEARVRSLPLWTETTQRTIETSLTLSY